MRKILLCMPVIGICFLSCQKPDVTVYTGPTYPAFTVNGVEDIHLSNGSTSAYGMALTITYTDSAQENVSLSISTLPPGISIDTALPMAGIPTFSTQIVFQDTGLFGATPGTYPMTLTAVGSRSGTKTYTFNLKILAAPSYTANVVGGFDNSMDQCRANTYADSVYNDASIVNKIWFTNFGGYGILVYGSVNAGANITIPSQTVGGYTVSGSGFASGTSPGNYIQLNTQITHNSVTTSCQINDQH